jgi:hypothetical protein
MERARPAESGFFPLDEELGLLSGSLTPSQEEHLVHLATWMPFAKAGQMLHTLLGVQVSEATIRRHTEEAGAAFEQVQTRESQQAGEPEEHPRPASPGVRRLVISSDGAYVPLVAGEWAEVRTLVIGEVAEPSGPPGQECKTSALSYFSRMTDASTFADLAQGEMQRRDVIGENLVCAVMDGAEWLQGFIDLHRPDALRILDFPHAAQRLGAIAEAIGQTDQPLPAEWLSQHCHLLKHEGPDKVLSAIGEVQAQRGEVEGVREHLHYLEKRKPLMDYPTYQQQGWPIGSGIVESGNKVVMQARLKGAGMRWARPHVNPMLALRTAVCNDRWEEAWTDVMTQKRDQRFQQRQERAQTRFVRAITPLLLLFIRCRPSPPSLPPMRTVLPAPSPISLPHSPRPSAAHPWRRPFISPPKALAAAKK